ncbi:MAG: hypothetical protein KF760_29865 [Candidatus Eremiobacteraeota bacterium]|nr:hypothetical protein [Candidatus Eremiobacteraeota bacterium]MCW5866910.1 hypothetical protein [Candidatus Eremiobacteraeota bacterium]
MIEERLSQEARHHSSGQFTLDSAVAWKKLRAHQVHQPGRYACELVAAGVALGAKWLDIHFQPKLARVHLRGCELDRRGLEGLLSHPVGHPLMLGLLGAQRYYQKSCRIRVVCQGGICRIEGERLELGEGGEGTGILVEIQALGGSFFSPARLDHALALDYLEEECQDGVLHIEVNGRALTRPVSLGDSLTTVRLVHPDFGMPEFVGRAFEVREMESPGPFCALVGCLSHKQETVISNGRVLLRRQTPGYSAFVFLREAELDLSGELVGGGRALLELVHGLVRQTLLEWAGRPNLPEAYKERLHQFWADWLVQEPEGPLADRLHFSLCCGDTVPLRDLLGKPVYFSEGPLQGPVLRPDPLLLRLFPEAVKLPTPPEEVRVSIEAGPEGLCYDPQGEYVDLILSDPAQVQAALTAAQLLPPGSRWSTWNPGKGVSQPLLELLEAAAREPARLPEVLGYLGWAGQRFQVVAQKLLGLRMRMGGKISLPNSALDAMLGRADEMTLSWLVDGGLLVGLGELESVNFLPTRSGKLVSLLGLLAAPKVFINQDHPDSLLVPPEYAGLLQQFVGAIRRGVVSA